MIQQQDETGRPLIFGNDGELFEAQTVRMCAASGEFQWGPRSCVSNCVWKSTQLGSGSGTAPANGNGPGRLESLMVSKTRLGPRSHRNSWRCCFLLSESF